MIPTYNRSVELNKNLCLLSNIIKSTNATEKVEIVISDNYSNDNTNSVIQSFVDNNKDINIRSFRQKENTGVLNNITFVLSEANGMYAMYLGDDDYISTDYLDEVFRLIQSDDNIHAIIPNFFPVSPSGEKLGNPRNKEELTVVNKKGKLNSLLQTWKGHQMSGLVFTRLGILTSYHQDNAQNLYPFIYFLSKAIQKGNLALVTMYPIAVTQPIKPKDWGYGKDGLISDIFINYNSLNLNILITTILQLNIYIKMRHRLWAYKKKGMHSLLKAFYIVEFNAKGTLIFKFLFPIIFIFHGLKRTLRKALKS